MMDRGLLERIGGLMADETHALFLAALKYKLTKEKISQAELAAATGITPQHLNAVICERIGRNGKIIRASSGLQQRVAQEYGHSYLEFLAIGQMVVDGNPPEKEKSEIEGGENAIHSVSIGPTDYVNPDEVVAAVQAIGQAVQALAVSHRRSEERQKWWKEVYDMLPSPTLIVKDGIVYHQNQKSLAWGRATGKPICMSFFDEDCPGDDCPLRLAIEANHEATIYRYFKDDYYKVVATPMRYGGNEYFIVVATEINECSKSLRKNILSSKNAIGSEE